MGERLVERRTAGTDSDTADSDTNADAYSGAVPFSDANSIARAVTESLSADKLADFDGWTEREVEREAGAGLLSGTTDQGGNGICATVVKDYSLAFPF